MFDLSSSNSADITDICSRSESFTDCVSALVSVCSDRMCVSKGVLH